MRLDSYPDRKGRNGIEALASLLDDSEQSPRYHGALVSLRVINVLPQPRQTFEEIDTLALGMARKGQIEPPIVLRLDHAHCEHYLTAVNLMWKTTFHVSGIHAVREGKKLWYHILVAGERRYRALRSLWKEGCDRCVRRHGKEAPGTCFRRHFRRKKDLIEVRLCTNEPPLSALLVQCQENTHMAVPPHEEARAYAYLFEVVRQVKERYTLAQFARDVGRRPEVVRNALHFIDLPVAVRGYIEKGAVPYGIGVELARLHRSGMKRRELEWWALRAITERRKVPEFRELVTKYLSRDPAQLDLLGIMKAEEEKLRRRLHIRRTVAAETIHAIWAWIRYFERVHTLFLEKKLGLPDSPFSERSPRRVLLALVEEMEKTLPHFKKLLSVRRYAETSETLGHVRETVWRLNARLDGDKRDASVSHPL